MISPFGSRLGAVQSGGASKHPQGLPSDFCEHPTPPAYGNVLDWVHASFTKVVWKNHPSLSFIEVLIRTSWSWKASNFAANSPEDQQVLEFIRGRFLGRYGAPLAPEDTTSA